MIWLKGPPASLHHRPFPVKPEHRAFVRGELQRWLDSGYVRELTAQEAKRQPVILPAFVANSDSKPRLVIDARYTNKHCAKRSVKYEDLRDLALVIRPGDHLISFDIKDGYHHLSLTRSAQGYLCFRVMGRFFLPVTMPFGWSLAPYYFVKFMRPV